MVNSFFSFLGPPHVSRNINDPSNFSSFFFTRLFFHSFLSSGSSSDCENYGTTIRVSKSLDNERYSTVYNGAVCPIDIKGAVEVEAHGCGLNIRDAQMEKIFVKQMEEDGEEERFKFWIVVDIYKVNE